MLNKLIEKLQKEEEISPILFIGEDLISTKIEVLEIIDELLKKFGVDKSSFYFFEDNKEKFKIENSRKVIEILGKKPNFKFQIIFIENISRFTIGASNSLLKIFEEPGVGNIIFLTNSGENDILETILSRVVIERIHYRKNFLVEKEIYNMIENYFNYDNPGLLYYLYKNSKNLEKQDYLKIIDNAIDFCKKNDMFFDKIEKFLDLKNFAIKNNVNLKYNLDKILFEK